MSLPVAILAGGLATRLRPVTDQIPKALLDVAGEPFAVRQIELLRQHGLIDIVFCLGHLGEQVEALLGDGRTWGVNLQYVYDGPVPLGTGGALRKALPFLRDAFIVLYGDSYLECDYQEVIRAFRSNGKAGLMTVYRNCGRWDKSNVILENGAIKCYDKSGSSKDMEHIDYGLGILQASAVEPYPAGETLDLETIYQDLLARRELAGFEVTHRFYEIGSPAGLDETREYFSRKNC